MKHHVILVREWDAQMAASGCCGRLGGMHDELGEAGTFMHNRREMEAMGAVYRRLRAEFGHEDLDLTVVDPRNTMWLISALLLEAWRRGISVADAWHGIRDGVAYNAIIANGRVLYSGRVPAPDEALGAVKAELGRASYAA